MARQLLVIIEFFFKNLVVIFQHFSVVFLLGKTHSLLLVSGNDRSIETLSAATTLMNLFRHF